MSVTSGFFNSVNGDRRYDARQMTALFNGIINDGIFANIGTAFTVSANGGNDIVIGVGRAWFNSTWVDNDAILPMSLDVSEVLLHRYDAVVIEIDQSDAVRDGSIKIIKGVPSSAPEYPEMVHTNEVNQYPLAYIYRAADSSAITQADITSMIGTSNAPYITGILQVQNIDNIVAQWQDQWARWFANKAEETDEWAETKQDEFNEWFNDVKKSLEGDVAGALLTRIVNLENGITPVGNADKLDGKSAEEFAKAEELTKVDGTEVLTTPILETALTLPDGEYEFKMGGYDYTDTSDLPHRNYAWGYATVYKWNDEYVVVHLHGYSTWSPVWNAHTNSGWSGWQTSLSTTGGTLSNAKAEVLGIANTSAKNALFGFYGSGALMGHIGIQEGIPVFVNTQNSYKQLLHTGNSTADKIQAGTLGGRVVANASAVTTLGTKQVRNIYAGTAELTAGVSALPAGDIYVQYE